MARRLAASGYAVLAPNPFYRVTKAPGIDSTNFSFSNQADRAKLWRTCAELAGVDAPVPA